MPGWDAEDLIGKSMHQLHHHTWPDGTPFTKEACPICAAFNDGEVHHVDDEVFWRKDGSSFPVDYTSTPIVENGNLAGAVVVFQDITERKRAEEALYEAYAKIAHMKERLEAENSDLQEEIKVEQNFAGIEGLHAGLCISLPPGILRLSTTHRVIETTGSRYLPGLTGL